MLIMSSEKYSEFLSEKLKKDWSILIENIRDKEVREAVQEFVINVNIVMENQKNIIDEIKK